MSGPVYRERLRVPFWWVAAVLVVTVLVAAQVHGGAGGWRAVVPYAVLLPLAVLVLVRLSRHEVRVQDGVLHVPGARAPLAAFGPAEALDREALRLWRGPAASPEAYVAVRPWLTGAVRLPVVDPADDTPYWLVGTRDPAGLLLALSPVPESPGP